MTNLDKDKVIQVAYEQGVEVIWAKVKSDVEIPGIHLVEPTYDQLLNGLVSALKYNHKIIVVHSMVTWPYRGL